MKKKLISLVTCALCIQFAFSESFHFVAEKDVIGIYYGKKAEEYLDYQNIIKKGTSSEVLTVMSEGEKVQILEIGKSDIIGGIKSNWVNVKIQKGSRTPEGHLIRSGLIGWCYGGYLE